MADDAEKRMASSMKRQFDGILIESSDGKIK